MFYATLLDVGLTEFTKIQTPHITPVILLGGCAVLLPLLTVLAASMDALGSMPQVRWYDVVKVFGLAGVAAISGLQNFMNQTYGRYREDKQKQETELLAKGTTQGDHAKILG